MKLIIDIPEEAYNEIVKDTITMSLDTQISVINAIQDGTPLPEGHGRLIDADKVKENHERWIGYLDEDMITRLNIAVDKHIPTVIEADKEEKND